jgi:asparagine synthase (glutamine-hydrolysing)
MCGIVGVVHADGQPPVDRRIVQRMCTAILHRGPDDEGLRVDGQVGLGMRRLSIIDLAGGHQPVLNENGSCAIVFNGEIYNYRDLRQGLLARGHTLRTHSDTETIIHLYEDAGADCVKSLRGMFAFAIWDDSRHTLLLARDRFGIKPLYVVQARWGIAFASELKALHTAGLTGGALDLDALDTYLQLGYIPAPASPFLGVRKLPPGHTLTWHADGRAEQRCYWDLPRAHHQAPPDVEARVRDWLDESVQAHLESDVPVAAFLSGGLDSSAVVASMAAAGERPHAFTARYHGSGAEAADESGLAKQLAGRYGARLTVVDVTPDVRDLFEPIVRALDEPHADESAIPSWLISQAVAQQYKVALVGTGGDELFAGYRRHAGLLLSEHWQRVPPWLRRQAARLAGALREPAGGSLGINRLKRFLHSGAGGVAERYFDQFTRLADGVRGTVLAPDLLARLAPTGERTRWTTLHAEGGAPAGLRAALYLDYKTYLPDDILALSDRLSMAHSLEVRVPFVDHILVEHVYPLPDVLKLRRLRGKLLLRRALQPRLPEAHFRAPKRGFVGPTASWLRHELRTVLCDELSEERLRRLGYFAPGAVTALLNDHFGRRHNREGILWELLCFSVWHRLYVEGPAAAPYLPSGF